ncbi:MAG: S8 family serine peptidase [Ezakiella sp.]|uniref:S8 family serine peptidase n=1 Tax=Ezakiella sp. TaxID=1935205 RepID=UPI0029704755|nr:S8 family serine peptidase [Ezakiella sp.]MDD7731103.1 S8 family serine peptidase [Eubacteriales bacterium]MDY6079715.1 S8 family serine peptidase [Ezakiella sp.]
MRQRLLSLFTAGAMIFSSMVGLTTNVRASENVETVNLFEGETGVETHGNGLMMIDNVSEKWSGNSADVDVQPVSYALTEKDFGEKTVYIVELSSEEMRGAVKEALLKLPQTEIKYEYNILFNGLAVETGDGFLDYILHIDGVKSVERAEKVIPLMENARELTHVNEASDYLKEIGADENSIGRAFDGRGMLIANIDSGMDARHKDMRLDPEAEKVAKIKQPTEFGMSMKIPHGFNYMDGGKNTVDNYPDGSFYHDPHGMHIGGILAANATEDDLKNHRGIRGIAPNAQVLSYKIYTYTSDAFAGDETMFHAFEDCIKHDVDVISISSGFHGTGLKGEKYWGAIRTLREKGIPVCVATGNYATASSDSSWDRYANNALNMTDTGNVTRTAAHEDAIAVGSARNTKIRFNAVKIGDEEFKYSQIGAFFDKNKFKAGDYSFVYLGKCQDEDILGKDLEGKIVVMDRIFSTDMKYAFKKVRDKGALGVIVVNTVSYYNRDDWEAIPAMGYEEDEKTKVQVFSISGEDGVKLWSMIKSYDGDTDYKSDREYRVDMNKYNKLKPTVGQENKLLLDFNVDDIILDEKRSVPAGSTSWGPRNDLLLKPDVSAPGKNIYSTLNVVGNDPTKDSRYGYMSGTSMATPVVSASTVLIRPRLKELVETKVLKDMGIDLVSLTKIMLQNTASPMLDETTENDGKYLFASPRQQGAGLINILKASKNNVVVSSKALGSDGQTNSYGSVSLREIKTGEKTFTITLSNTSDKDIKFTVSASPVTTDGNMPKLKLDELNSTEDKGKTVAEIHPEIVNGAEIKFDTEEITVPANSNFNLSATMKTGDAHNKFVESFIKFESKDEEANPSLSMPVMGFAGDWNNEPIIDKWAWEEGSKSAEVVGYDENGKPKRPGTLNSGVGGDHDIDDFHPAGVIQNTKDGNPKLKQDPELFSLNNNISLNNSVSRSDVVKDFEAIPNVTPSPLILRSASNAKISIVDATKTRDLKVMNVSQFVRGILNSKRNTASGLKPSRLKILGDLKWDGRIYNPHHVEKKEFGGKEYEEIIGGEYPLAEGQYYYEFMYRLTPDYPWQKSYIPVKIDNTKPTIESVDVTDPNKIKIVAKDTYHKQKEEFKDRTFYLTDQVEMPEKFKEVERKVWFVGANLDKDYDDTKKLTVYKEDDGSYVIENISKDLIGSKVTIAALDGASNVSDEYVLKFAEPQDGKVEVKLFRIERKMVGFNEEKEEILITEVEIDESKFGKKEESVPSEDNKDDDDETPQIAPDFEIYKGSTYRELEAKDLRRDLVNPLLKEGENPFTHEKITEEIYAVYDENGQPTQYENGEPLQYHDETLEELKNSGYIGMMTPNEDGGFNIRGKILNANKKTRVYFASKGMKKLFRTAKVQTLNYNDKDKTLEFDFYANVNDDSDSTKDYNDEVYITASNGSKEKTIKIRMPKREVKKEKGTAPVIPGLNPIEDSATGEFNQKVRVVEDNEKKRYFVKTSFKIADGYTIKLVCYNPGKNGLEAIEEAKYYSSDMSDKYIDIEILPGFNMLRMEVFKADKQNEVNENNIYESKGFCLYYDDDGPELDMNTASFNPDKNGTLYIKKSPLVVEGVVGDKGGFNWHMRINESMVDEYLIYGDLTSDNHRPFRVEIPCKDKDVMDWNVKDYAGNSPDNFMAQHIIRIDNKKPEIKIEPEVQGDYTIETVDSMLGISITDKVDNGDKGSIMLKEVFVNGEAYDANKKLEDYTSNDGKYTIYVRAVDYAYNASVKTYIYDPNAAVDKIEEVANEEVTVTVDRDNGYKAEEFIVNKGEDFALPEVDFEIPEGKVFAGWDIDGKVRNAGETIFVDKDTTVRAIYKNKEEKVYVNIHFERNGGRGSMEDIKAEVGATVKLPLNGFDSPSDKSFDCWMVKGEKKNPGDAIVVDGDLTVTAIWKVEMRKPDKKPDVPFVPHTPEEGHDYFKPHRRINNKKDVTKEKKNEKKTETAVVKDEGKKTTADVNTDYNSHWAKNAIVECFAKGIFNDFANKTVFMPEKPTTRAEFVTALGRLMNINPAEFNKNIFEDVDSNEFYAPFINWAASKKIVLGVDAKHFEPNKTLTREQMATIIVRLFRTYGYNFETNLMKPIYKDDKEISDWAKEEVYELTNIGIVQGNADSTFNPKGYLKRGELAELVLKLTKKLEK